LDDDLQKNNVAIIGQNEIEKIKPEIGSGKFGKVYKGKYKGIDVAIKKMVIENLDQEANRAEVISEIKNLQVAVSEHVPKFYGVWKGLNGKHYNLVFEFIEGKSLRDILKTLTFDEKISILYQTAEIANFLHNRKMFHRDIKPDNIMVNMDTMVIKMIDFGTAKLATKTITFTSKAVGTTIYMAPDFFDIDVDDDGDKPIANTPKVDIWSIGCMMSEMMSGVEPWHNLTKSEKKVEAYLIKQTPFPIPKEIMEKHPEFQGMIEKCTKLHWQERCSTEEVMEFLKPMLKVKK
jgi:serine/threonine protein kinase